MYHEPQRPGPNQNETALSVAYSFRRGRTVGIQLDQETCEPIRWVYLIDSPFGTGSYREYETAEALLEQLCSKSRPPSLRLTSQQRAVIEKIARKFKRKSPE